MRKCWDFLIILDACRYDYFEKIFRNYIYYGNLYKAISPATWTFEWAKKVFPRTYNDVIYISANPYIRNSPAITNKQVKNIFIDDQPFVSEKHFFKVIDVWRSGWDETIGTVHPKTVNRAVLDVINNYPDKRVIVHYMQPHYPYFSLGGRKFKPRKLYSFIELVSWLLFGEKGFDFGTLKRINLYAQCKLGNILLDRKEIRRTKSLVPPNPVRLVARNFGTSNLKKFYEYNLRIVLFYVAKLINHLEGKIAVTSDHGELLGEEGMYGHSNSRISMKRMPALIEIPWLEITKKSENTNFSSLLRKKNRDSGKTYSFNKEEIKKRLKTIRIHTKKRLHRTKR